MSTKQIEAMDKLVEAKAAGLELKDIHHKTREVLVANGWAQIKTTKKSVKIAATPEGKKTLKALLKAA